LKRNDGVCVIRSSRSEQVNENDQPSEFLPQDPFKC